MLPLDTLKEREREILELIAEGMTNREVGDRLYLAEETVRWYTKQIYTKLNVRNRTEAVNRARELGMLLDGFTAPPVRVISAPMRSNTQHIPRYPIQYANADGVYIAYQVIGDGPVDLLVVNGFVSHLEFMWEQPLVAQFFEELASFSRLILFDKRGVGLSDRVGYTPTLDDINADMLAVLDAVDSKSAVILGTCVGGPAAIQFQQRYPERVEKLVLFNTSAKMCRTGNTPRWAVPVYVYDRVLQQMQQEWGTPYALEYYAPSVAHDETVRAWWAKLLRLGASPGAAISVLETMRHVDITGILPCVSAPTLILHRAENRMIWASSGRFMSRRIPGATFIELPGADHFIWLDSSLIVEYTRRFVLNQEIKNIAGAVVA